MLSFLWRSECRLKVLSLRYAASPPEDLSALLKAIPSLEHLELSFDSHSRNNVIMDDILVRIFFSDPGRSNTPVGDTKSASFLPSLQIMECRMRDSAIAPFSWDLILQLYRLGHWRSLVLKSAASKGQIPDETTLQLLQLVDEGIDLQIDDMAGGYWHQDFLKNFRNRFGGL
jgi:hypothetical protein